MTFLSKGPCVTETHWDAKGGANGSGTLIGLANTWQKADENWVVAVNVNTGTGTGLIQFPGKCTHHSNCTLTAPYYDIITTGIGTSLIRFLGGKFGI